MRLAKALIRLRVCEGLSEPLLVAHTTLLEISCHGSNVKGFHEGSIAHWSFMFMLYVSLTQNHACESSVITIVLEPALGLINRLMPKGVKMCFYVEKFAELKKNS